MKNPGGMNNYKGDPENVSSFRPVSPTSIICKIDEGILKKIVLSFLSETRVISPHQRGDAHDEWRPHG